MVNDADPVGKLLGLFHVMGSVQDGHALLVERLDRVEDGAAGLRVDADGRFVHEEQAGLVQQPNADVDAPLHPAGIGLNPVFGFVGQADLLEHLVDAGLEVPAGETVHLAPEDQVFAGAEVVVERQFLGYHADQVAHDHRFPGDRMPADGRFAGSWGEERGKDGNGSGFSGSVWTKQAEDFACVYVERNSIHGGEIAVFLYKVFH